MSDAKEKGSGYSSPSQPSEMPKYDYQVIDDRTYSVDYRDPAKHSTPGEQIRSLRNLSL
jgi:hypothetical protein